MAASNAPDASSARPDQFVFILPDLGEGLEDAELIEWCVKVGQQIEENDILARMETAKALVEIPSPRGGVISILHGEAGQTIKVGSPLITFTVDPTVPEQAHPSEIKADPPPPPTEDRPDAGTVVGDIPSAPTDGGGVRAAPAVRRMARELGIDLERVTGTGIGGRITTTDVQAAAHNGGRRDHDTGFRPVLNDRQENAAPPSAPAEGHAVRIPFRGVRKTISERLRRSINHAVHFTVMEEADITALDTLRRKLMAASNEKLSVLPFVAAAVCRVLTGRSPAMATFGRLNCTVDDQRQEMIQHPVVHLGIATDTDSGLMTPVIRDAERLGVLELARRIAEIAKQARQRSLSPGQLGGSTFTISNVGSMGARFATPIINYPEAGILVVGRTREGVVVRNGMIGVGKLLPLSLSADHRVIDGGAAAAALAAIVDLLQSPDQLLPPGRER